MSTTIAQARLTLEELRQLKWLMGAVMSLLALWAAAGVEAQNGLLFAPIAALLAAVVAHPPWARRMPLLRRRFFPLALAALIAADIVLHLSNVLPAILRMVVLLMAYRALTERRKREDLQLIVLCLFCVVAAGVLTVSLVFALQILLFVPLALALLFVITLSETPDEAEETPARWTRFSWRRLARRVGETLNWRLLGVGGALFAMLVAVSTVIFILTPRFQLNQLIPMPELEGKSRSGFSERVAPGDVTDIKADNSVALRVDVPSLEAVGESPYWRMLTLDRYEGGHFELSASAQSEDFQRTGKTSGVSGWGIDKPVARGASWTFYLEGGISKYLPLPGPASEIRFQGEQNVTVTRDLYLLNLDKVPSNVFFYRVEGLRFSRRVAASKREKRAFERAEGALAGDGAEYPRTLLELPLDESERSVLRETLSAAGAGEDGLSTVAFAKRLTRHLRERHEYTLSPREMAGDRDPIAAWLDGGFGGHCEYFAGALVLLAREAGIPARMATGFAGGGWNSVEEYFVVRNSEAHAWTELYDAASGEWVRVDPTPGSGPVETGQTVTSTVNYERGWGAWIDSLRIQWYRRIVDFDQDDQQAIMASLGDAWKSFKKRAGEIAETAWAGLKRRLLAPFSKGGLVLIAWLAGLAALVGLAFRHRRAIAVRLRRLLRRSPRMDPAREQASRYLKRLRERGLFDAPDADAAEVRDQLEWLRFGPSDARPDAAPIFARARALLRRAGHISCRRDGDRAAAEAR